VHQVGLSLHDYIEMHGQRNIKKEENLLCRLLAHRSGRCRKCVNMQLQRDGHVATKLHVASKLNKLQQQDIFGIACVRKYGALQRRTLHNTLSQRTALPYVILLFDYKPEVGLK